MPLDLADVEFFQKQVKEMLEQERDRKLSALAKKAIGGGVAFVIGYAVSLWFWCSSTIAESVKTQVEDSVKAIQTAAIAPAMDVATRKVKEAIESAGKATTAVEQAEESGRVAARAAASATKAAQEASAAAVAVDKRVQEKLEEIVKGASLKGSDLQKVILELCDTRLAALKEFPAQGAEIMVSSGKGVLNHSASTEAPMPERENMPGDGQVYYSQWVEIPQVDRAKHVVYAFLDGLDMDCRDVTLFRLGHAELSTNGASFRVKYFVRHGTPIRDLYIRWILCKQL